VPDFTLTSAPPLAGYKRSFGSVTLQAPNDLAIVSVAFPLGEEAAAEKAVKTAFGVALPDVGKSGTAKDASVRVARLGIDQAFVLFTHPTPDAEPYVAGKFKGKAYTTDQTDSWSSLELSGPDSRRVLERICPLDLHDSTFAINDVARTSMEHLGSIIVRSGPDTYLLLSASSSAKTFLHAVETSIANVL